MTLKRLFIVVAIVEALYGLAGLGIPPSAIGSLLGWDLSPDGQWVTKLLGAALFTQAATAWFLRERATREVAVIFAAYQLLAVCIDAVVLTSLDGALANPMARASALIAIPTHGIIGLLLLASAARTAKAEGVAS